MTNEEAIERLRRVKELKVFGTSYMPALDLAIAALERDRWIGVEETPQKKVGDDGYTGYMVYAEGYYKIADYAKVAEKKLFGIYDVYRFMVDGEFEPDVVAFRPLPEPPKEET